MKYLLYYLIPKKVLYRMLYNTMSVTTGFLPFNDDNAYIKTTYISYDEYKELTKAEKMSYIEKYVKEKKVLNYIDKNILALICRIFKI